MNQIIEFVANNKAWLTYIPTIIFGVIVVLWLLRGFMKGFRKSLIQLIYMAIAVVVAVIAFYILAENGGKMLYGLVGGMLESNLGVSMPNDYNEIFNANISASDVTISELICTVLFKQLANQSGGVANVAIEYYDYVLVFTDILIRFVYFLIAGIVYYLVKILLWIFYLLFFREGAYKKKLERRGKKYHKRRILGSLVGAVRGVCVGLYVSACITAIIYIITAAREPQETKFTDQTISGVYDISNLAREMGDTGVSNVLNSITVDEVPIYIYVIDQVLQAEYRSTGETVYLTKEVVAISGLANDIIDIWNLYAGDLTISNDTNELLVQVEDIFSSTHTLEYQGEQRTFEEAMITVLDKYEGTVLMNNLLKSTIGAVINLTMSITEEDNIVYQVLDAMFGVDENSEYYISPSDLTTFDDCKKMLIGVIDACSEILDVYNYTQNFEDGHTYTSSEQVTLLNKALACVEPLSNAINELSIFTDYEEDTVYNHEMVVSKKKTKLNKAIDNAVDVVFNYLAENSGNNYQNPYANLSIDWLNDFSLLFETAMDLGDITSLYEEELGKNSNLDLIGATNIIFAEDYVNRTKLDNAYDTLVSDLSNYDVVNVLLESDFMYDTYYDNFLSQVVSQVNGTSDLEVKLPRDIKFADTLDENGNVLVPGELRVLFNTLRDLVRADLLENLDIENMNIETVDHMIGVFTDTNSNNESIISYTLNSKFLHYSISLIMTNVDRNNIKVLVPSDDLYSVDGVDIIKKEELVDLISCLKPVTEELLAQGYVEFSDLSEDQYGVLDVVATKEVQDAIISSDILVATASYFFVSTVKSDESLQNYIVIPERLDYSVDDEAKNEASMANWTGQNGEFAKILNILLLENPDGSKVLDLKQLSNLSNSYIVSLINISESNFNELIASDLIHYSFTKILTTVNTDELSIVIPTEVYDKTYTDYNVIATSELYNTLHAASYILSTDSADNLTYDLNAVSPNSEEILKSNILHATLIDKIMDLAVSDTSDLVKLPNEYSTLNYDVNSSESIYNDNFSSNPWVVNNEINNVLDAIEALDINLGDLTNSNIDQNALIGNILLLNDYTEDNTKLRVDVVCSSKVLSMTLTHNMINNENIKDYIVVPSTALTDANSYNDQYIEAREWLSLVDGLEHSLGVSRESETPVIEQIQDINARLANVFVEDTYTYEAKKEYLLSSYILERSVVNNIYDQLDSSDMSGFNLVIPDYLKENDYVDWLSVRNTDDSISSYKELGDILDVFKTTGLGEAFGNQDTFTSEAEFLVSVYNLIVNVDDYDSNGIISENLVTKQAKQASIIKSDVLKATVINTLIKTNAVDIPVEYNPNNILALEVNKQGEYVYGDNTAEAIKANFKDLAIADYGSEDPTDSVLAHIFNALNELELLIERDRPDVISLTADTLLLLNDRAITDTSANKAEVITKSKLISLTLSNEALNATGLEASEVPAAAVDVENTDTYIKASEWANLVNAIEYSFGVTSGVATAFSDVPALIQYLVGPKTNAQGHVIDPDSTTDSEALAYQARRDGVLASRIVEATIVKNVKSNLVSEENKQDYYVIIPADTIWYKDDADDLGLQSELQVLLDVFKLLGLGEQSTTNNYSEILHDDLKVGSVIYVNGEDATTAPGKALLQRKVVDSRVLQASIIDDIVKTNTIKLPISLRENMDDNTVLSETNWYKYDEVYHLFEVSTLLGLTSNNDSDISFNIDNTLKSLQSSNEIDGETPINYLANSTVAYYNVSTNILDVVTDSSSSLKLYMPFSKVVVNNYYDTNDSYRVVESTELQNLIDDIIALGITSITQSNTSSTDDSSKVTKPTNEQLNNNSVLKSDTLRLTISQMIIDNVISSTQGSSAVDYIAEGKNITDVYQNVYYVSGAAYGQSQETIICFSVDEIKSFIKAVNALGNSSNTTEFSFTLPTDVNELIDTLSNVDSSVLDSGIAHAIISNRLVEIYVSGGSLAGMQAPYTTTIYKFTTTQVTPSRDSSYYTKDYIINTYMSNSSTTN